MGKPVLLAKQISQELIMLISILPVTACLQITNVSEET